MNNLIWKEIRTKCPCCGKDNVYQFSGTVDYAAHVKCDYCGSIMRLSGSKVNQEKESISVSH